MIESYNLIVFLKRLSNLLFYLDQSKKQNAFSKYNIDKVVMFTLNWIYKKINVQFKTRKIFVLNCTLV